MNTLDSERYGNSFHRPTLIAHSKYLLKRTLRFFLFREIPVRHPYLNLGCGSTILEGFHNADFFTPAFWRHGFDQMDATRRLRYADRSFKGVFCEHVLEHIYPADLPSVLHEVFRVLQPGGVLRISVPDLRKYVDFYLGKPVDERFNSLFRRKAEAIWGLTQNWNHVNVFDFDIVRDYLLHAGFVDVRECSFRNGSLDEICRDSPNRRWESLYVEGLKPG